MSHKHCQCIMFTILKKLSNLYFPKVVKGSDSEWYKKIVQMHKMKNGARLSYIFQVRYHKNTDYNLHTQ